MLRTLAPIIFERSLTGALVYAPMRRLIGLVREHALGILQMSHPARRARSLSGKQVLKKFA